MSELKQAPALSAVYEIESRDETVATAKSQFSDKFDVPYSEVTGTIIKGNGWNYGEEKLVVVVHTG